VHGARGGGTRHCYKSRNVVGAPSSVKRDSFLRAQLHLNVFSETFHGMLWENGEVVSVPEGVQRRGEKAPCVPEIKCRELGIGVNFTERGCTRHPLEMMLSWVESRFATFRGAEDCYTARRPGSLLPIVQDDCFNVNRLWDSIAYWVKQNIKTLLRFRKNLLIKNMT
jgi:hypothetical protein